MKKENIVRYKSDEIKKTSKTDWNKFDSLKDKDIDLSEIHELDKEWFKTADIILPEKKQSISIRVDKDVINWFKSKGKGYQTLMNAVLKSYVDVQKKY